MRAECSTNDDVAAKGGQSVRRGVAGGLERPEMEQQMEHGAAGRSERSGRREGGSGMGAERLGLDPSVGETGIDAETEGLGRNPVGAATVRKGREVGAEELGLDPSDGKTENGAETEELGRYPVGATTVRRRNVGGVGKAVGGRLGRYPVGASTMQAK